MSLYKNFDLDYDDPEMIFSNVPVYVDENNKEYCHPFNLDTKINYKNYLQEGVAITFQGNLFYDLTSLTDASVFQVKKHYPKTNEEVEFYNKLWVSKHLLEKLDQIFKSRDLKFSQHKLGTFIVALLILNRIENVVKSNDKISRDDFDAYNLFDDLQNKLEKIKEIRIVYFDEATEVISPAALEFLIDKYDLTFSASDKLSHAFDYISNDLTITNIIRNKRYFRKAKKVIAKRLLEYFIHITELTPPAIYLLIGELFASVDLLEDDEDKLIKETSWDSLKSFYKKAVYDMVSDADDFILPSDDDFLDEDNESINES